MRSIGKYWANLIFFVIMIAANAAANLMKLGGGTTGEVSAKYSNVFTPAGWTFAIWGAIYALLLIPAVGPLINPNGYAAQLMDKLKGWFILSCILNTAWILLWHFDKILLSWVTMIALLGTLFVMFSRYSAASGASGLKLPTVQTAGLSVYFGWICAAALANTMVLFVSLGMDGYKAGAQITASLMLIIGATAITVLSLTGNWLLSITGIWAYSGILYNQISPDALNGRYKVVIFSTLIGMGILTAGVFLSLSVAFKSIRPKAKTV